MRFDVGRPTQSSDAAKKMLVAASCLTAALVTPPSTTIVGGGPAGLATAIMLARKGYKNIKVLDRLPPPAAAGDASVWSDTAKHYLVGLERAWPRGS